MNKIAIGICEYKTNKFTNFLLRSIFKNLKSVQYEIFILDQNDIPFELEVNNDKNISINIIRNNNQCLFKYRDDLKIKNLADYKHSKNIQYLMDICEYDNFLLFDSDTILKKDIDFVDDSYISCGSSIPKNRPCFMLRISPYIQYFNLRKMKEIGLKYLDEDEIQNNFDIIKKYLIKYRNSYRIYTGCIFTNKIVNNKLDYKEVKIYDYINHYRCANSINNKEDIVNKWYRQNIRYFK